MRVEVIGSIQGTARMGHDLSLVRRRDGDHVVVELAGELDLAGRDRLVEVVTAGLSEAPVILDLAGLVFVDSTGLGALIRCRNLAAELGRRLSLRNPTGQVAATIAMTGLDRAFAPTADPAP